MAHSPLRWLLDRKVVQPTEFDCSPAISLKRAGVILGLSYPQMRRLLERGVIKAHRAHPRGKWRVSQATIQKLKDQNQ